MSDDDIPRNNCEYHGIDIEAMAIIVADLQHLIRILEERIISLERKESVVHILPSDHYYWEHG